MWTKIVTLKEMWTVKTKLDLRGSEQSFHPSTSSRVKTRFRSIASRQRWITLTSGTRRDQTEAQELRPESKLSTTTTFVSSSLFSTSSTSHVVPSSAKTGTCLSFLLLLLSERKSMKVNVKWVFVILMQGCYYQQV